MQIKSFKEFAFKGNIVDMAVGVVIGGAFGGIVSSFVADILNPLIGLLFKADFAELFVVLKSPDGQFFPQVEQMTLAAAKEAGYITFNYGSFITTVINFIILALALYFILKGVIKAVNAMAKKPEPAPAPVPTTKQCPYCKSEIAIDAVRCPHCTSNLDKPE